MSLKVMLPTITTPDQGEGGIRRVIEAQRRHLPKFDVEVVDTEAEADVVAVHAGEYVITQKPYVVHNHGLYWAQYQWQPWAYDLNDACINNLRRCDAATAPSDWVGYIIKRGMNIDARTVYHGLDVGDWNVGDKSRPYVLWNKTRVDPICDPTPVNRLAEALPEVGFVSTFGSARDNLRVTGRLPYPQAKLLVESCAVYLATARETFGVGTLEAMASGAVVVGYGWGGQSEIIQHGVNGLLVPPHNIGALRDAVLQALDPATRARIGEAARATVAERFTWEQACENYADAYMGAYQARPDKRISVVITCYNLAHVLPRAVASVDSPDAEIVVVNDASPDDTGAVAERLAHEDSRIRIVTNPSNLYLAGSLDAGVRAATGRYIVPLDADNELAPGALDTLAAALDAEQGIDVAYGSMLVQEEKPGGVTFVSGWPADFEYTAQMAHRNQCPSTSMYRRKWWERAGGYRRRCRTAEDADFWCRITSLGARPHKVTNQVTLIYHDRSDSMSHVEADWDWTAWYPWGRLPDLTPWGAPTRSRRRVPTYAPSMVTVVVPVGPGHAKYLPDALDSLVAQTYQNWCCVVVYNCPSEEWRVLPPWAPALTYDEPIGPARARNAGLEWADTPFVLFLDADDYLAPNALEILVQTALDRGREAEGTASAASMAREWYYSDWIQQEKDKVYHAPDFVLDHLRTRLTHSVTALYPVAALREVGGFDETLDAWEDWDLILKLIEHKNCGVHVPYPLLYYRYHTGTRREELYQQRSRHLEVMKAKWRKYMVENQPMPCGCGGGRTQYVPPVQVAGQNLPIAKDGMTKVVFEGVSAPRTYRGPSGREYRFGSDQGHREHYVMNQDLEMFINRPGYRVALGGGELPRLDAKGPPDRAAELIEPDPSLVGAPAGDAVLA